LESFESADDEVVHMTVGALFSDEHMVGLSEANERGVRIRLGGIYQRIQERIQADSPDADMYESVWVQSDTPAGWLMVVDGKKPLRVLSSMESRPPDRTPDPRRQSGEMHSQVPGCRSEAIFTW